MTFTLEPKGIRIDFEEIQEGDFIALRYAEDDYTHIKVQTIDEDSIASSYNQYYSRDASVEVYLLHRPQKPLPVLLGSIIAEVRTSIGADFDYAILLESGWLAVKDGHLRPTGQDLNSTTRFISWNEAKVIAIPDTHE